MAGNGAYGFLPSPSPFSEDVSSSSGGVLDCGTVEEYGIRNSQNTESIIVWMHFQCDPPPPRFSARSSSHTKDNAKARDMIIDYYSPSSSSLLLLIYNNIILKILDILQITVVQYC